MLMDSSELHWNKAVTGWRFWLSDVTNRPSSSSYSSSFPVSTTRNKTWVVRWAKLRRAAVSKRRWSDIVRQWVGTCRGCTACLHPAASQTNGAEVMKICPHPSPSFIPLAARRRRRIRWAGAEDPGRCPGPAGSSSGRRLDPAVQPRGTASCPRSPSPETEHRAAQTRSQRSLCPVSGGRKKKGEKITAAQSDLRDANCAVFKIKKNLIK